MIITLIFKKNTVLSVILQSTAFANWQNTVVLQVMQLSNYGQYTVGQNNYLNWIKNY